MHKPLLLLPLFAAACSFPQFSASKTVEMQVPVEQATRLACSTHNGGITITKGTSAETISLRATMSVRGHTQAEADENLHLLSVGQKRQEGTLSIFGEYPREQLINRSPSFAFEMQVPESMQLDLVSHNGDIAVTDMSGALTAETHNGRISGSIATPEVTVTTHNGDIELSLAAEGDLRGSVTTHNGDVGLTLAPGSRGWLEAATHNGRITPQNQQIREATKTRNSLRARLGEGPTEGRLQIETHNGDVVVR